LMSDPVAEYSLEEAIRVGRDLEKLDYHWFEEPFRDFELLKYAKLCAALDIAIAGTETTRGGPGGVAQVREESRHGTHECVRHVGLQDLAWLFHDKASVEDAG
ncbi:MAG: enolase C-terminal domain-like protein, partial [Bryobacteraceae bacterium]